MQLGPSIVYHISFLSKFIQVFSSLPVFLEGVQILKAVAKTKKIKIEKTNYQQSNQQKRIPQNKLHLLTAINLLQVNSSQYTTET